MKNRPTGRPGSKNRPAQGGKAPSRKPYGSDSKPYGSDKKTDKRTDKSPARKSYGFDKKPERRADKSTARPSEAKSFRPQTRERKTPHTPQGIQLFGLHAVREAWLNPDRKIHGLWMTEAGRASMEETFQLATERGLNRPSPTRIDKPDLDRMLPHSFVHQGLLLEAAPLPEMTLDDLLGQSDGPDLVVVLDQVTDPHNVGAILRSAAAFGAGAVIVTERNAPNTTGTMAKIACGAAEHVPLIPVVNLARTLEALQAESFWCVGLAEEGPRGLDELPLTSGRIALVLGAEGDGLRRLTRQHCDELARLPTQGPIGSLNVSNAAAVSLYEVRRQKGVKAG